MRFFPNLSEGLSGMLVVRQRSIVRVQCCPRTVGVERQTLALGQENVSFDGILVETVNARANLLTISICFCIRRLITAGSFLEGLSLPRVRLPRLLRGDLEVFRESLRRYMTVNRTAQWVRASL